MSERFDPYHEWLGIPASEQPPHHYRILGIPPFEENPTVIENAADRQMAHLRRFQVGQHVAESQRLLNEIAAAKLCLLTPKKKGMYDRVLRENLLPSSQFVVPPPICRNLQSNIGFADRAEADSLDPELLAILKKPTSGATPPEPVSREKKSLTNRLLRIGAEGLIVMAVGAIGLWWAVGHGRKASDRRVVKAGNPVTSAALPHEDIAKSPEPSKKETPVLATTKPNEDPAPIDLKAEISKAELPKSSQDTMPPVTPPQVDKTAESHLEAKPDTKPEPKREPKPEEEKPTRQAVPPKSVQQEIAAKVQEVYKTAEARTPEEQIKLAKHLAEIAETATKPEDQFGLLCKAAELAGGAGDTTLMFQMVDRLGGQFELDALSVKRKLLAKLAAGAKDAARIKSLVEGASAAIDEALAEDRFDMALELVNVANQVCQKHEGMPFRSKVPPLRKKIQEQKQLAEKIVKVLEALESNPDDAAANSTAGKLYCFAKGDWGKGLPYLAKGSDENLKTSALQETNSPPGDADEEVKLGDTWWNVGQAAKGKDRAAILFHAGTWYQQAQPNLPPGLDKARVDKRLEEIAGLGREIPTLPARHPPLAVAPFDEKTAQQRQASWARYLHVRVVQTNSIDMKFVLIPPGEFMMGSPKELIEEELKTHADEQWWTDHLPGEGPRHLVRITKPYWLGATDVTQEEYQRIMGANPSGFSATGQYSDAVAGQGTKRFPVEHVSWDEAVEFCRKLSELPEENAAARTYRLPSEAQWEYACRAGNAGPWCFSAQPNPLPVAVEQKLLGEYAWFNGNAGGMTHPVSCKQPSAWGLYDMYGNVWQWCADCYDTEYYAISLADDPVGPPSGSFRVLRGGSWFNEACYCRSANRGRTSPGYRDVILGFRVCLIPADK